MPRNDYNRRARGTSLRALGYGHNANGPLRRRAARLTPAQKFIGNSIIYIVAAERAAGASRITSIGKWRAIKSPPRPTL